MKKKVYYKLNRYQVTKVEVETAEAEEPETVKEVVPMAAQKD